MSNCNSFQGQAKALCTSLQSAVHVMGSSKSCGGHLYVGLMLKLDVCKLRTLCIILAL